MSLERFNNQVTQDLNRFRRQKIAEQNDPSLRYCGRGAWFLGGISANTSPRREDRRRDDADVDKHKLTP